MEQVMKPFVTALLLALSSTSVDANPTISGYWVVPGFDAVVHIETYDNRAKLIIHRTFDPTLADKNNPVKADRGQLISGLTLGSGFNRQGSDWTGGELYDPGSGKVYRATIRLLDEDHLQLRGYVGLPLLGRSQTWVRFDHFRDSMLTMLNAGSRGECHD